MSTIGRRELMAGGVAAAGVAAALGPRGAMAAEPTGGGHGALVDAALGCVRAGDLCLDHCLGTFRQGDTSLAACATTVADMIPVCQGLSRLAASRSKRLPAYAAACIQVCQDCEAECRKHESHHAICKDCAEACARVIEACKRVAA